MKKIFYYLIVFISIGSFFSCQHNIPLGDDVHTTFNIGNQGAFLNEDHNCGSSFEGSEKKLDVDVYVDIVLQDGTVQGNHWNGRLHLNNDMYNPDQWTVEAGNEILVPETGWYVVSVDCDARECFVCCSGSCSPGGEPKWRGVSTVINTDEPPPHIDIAMTYLNCY